MLFPKDVNRALTMLLMEKGIITEEEFFGKVKRVNQEMKRKEKTTMKGLTYLLFVVSLVIISGCATTPPVKNPQILPKAHFIIGVPVYKQPPNECGQTSLQMILNFYGKKITEDEIAKSTRYFKQTWMSEMERYVRQLNFEVYTIGWNEEKIKYLIAQDYPLIARGWTARANRHYVVITGYDDNEKTFIINDPAPGRSIKVSREWMKDFFSSAPIGEHSYAFCIYPKGK